MESPLVTVSRLQGKTIPAGKHFLLGNEGGYTGPTTLDAAWATSNTLAYTDNSILLYDTNGAKVAEVGWSNIRKDQSYERIDWASANFQIQATPTPQNSSQ